MKISAQEEYGLRRLVQLATLSREESLTLNQIAEREGISVANAGKLMWLLNKAGFVSATRGTKGGYTLARPAGDIYLNEIIRVLDELHGRFKVVRSQRRLRHSPRDCRTSRNRRKRAVANQPRPTDRRRSEGQRNVSSDTGNPSHYCAAGKLTN